MITPNIWKSKTCSKQPTSNIMWYLLVGGWTLPLWKIGKPGCLFYSELNGKITNSCSKPPTNFDLILLAWIQWNFRTFPSFVGHVGRSVCMTFVLSISLLANLMLFNCTSTKLTRNVPNTSRLWRRNVPWTKPVRLLCGVWVQDAIAPKFVCQYWWFDPI